MSPIPSCCRIGIFAATIIIYSPRYPLTWFYRKTEYNKISMEPGYAEATRDHQYLESSPRKLLSRQRSLAVLFQKHSVPKSKNSVTNSSGVGTPDSSPEASPRTTISQKRSIAALFQKYSVPQSQRAGNQSGGENADAPKRSWKIFSSLRERGDRRRRHEDYGPGHRTNLSPGKDSEANLLNCGKVQRNL